MYYCQTIDLIEISHPTSNFPISAQFYKSHYVYFTSFIPMEQQSLHRNILMN